jgi:predicted nuclease of predicted toxin-antitoxin system
MMRLLLDQDVYAVTARALSDAGHDVVLAAEWGLAQAPDGHILKVAQENERVVVTRDRDYGNLVFVREVGTGVIYLRLLQNNLNAVHIELLRVLQRYTQADLLGSFVVVEADRHRFRRPMEKHEENKDGSQGSS